MTLIVPDSSEIVTYDFYSALKMSTMHLIYHLVLQVGQ